MTERRVFTDATQAAIAVMTLWSTEDDPLPARRLVADIAADHDGDATYLVGGFINLTALMLQHGFPDAGSRLAWLREVAALIEHQQGDL